MSRFFLVLRFLGSSVILRLVNLLVLLICSVPSASARSSGDCFLCAVIGGTLLSLMCVSTTWLLCCLEDQLFRALSVARGLVLWVLSGSSDVFLIPLSRNASPGSL